MHVGFCIVCVWMYRWMYMRLANCPLYLLNNNILTCTLMWPVYQCVLRPLHEIVAATHIAYVISRAERAVLIPRLTRRCTSPWKVRGSKQWSRHNSPSKTFMAVYLVYPSSHLGGKSHVELLDDLLWPVLQTPVWSTMCFSLFLLLCVFLQRGHVEGRGPSAEHRRDAFKQGEARWRSDHADAERPGSSVPDWVWRLCHGWAHKHREYVEAW